MRASRVAVGVKVVIISGQDTGKLGIISGVKDGIIAVREVTSDHAMHYKSGQLRLATPDEWDSKIRQAAELLKSTNAAKKRPKSGK